MKLKFLGVPNEKHDTINMYGTTFPLGKVVTLDENDPRNRDALHKLPRHPYFEVVGDEAAALKVAAKLGDPVREAQREADEKRDARVATLTEQAAADKTREARELVEQDKIVKDLAGKEEAAEKAAEKAEQGKGPPADDAFVKIGAIRFSDGKIQTAKSLDAAITAWKAKHPK